MGVGENLSKMLRRLFDFVDADGSGYIEVAGNHIDVLRY
jgi:Ca2+-binding EF-hand superfamily protein